MVKGDQNNISKGDITESFGLAVAESTRGQLASTLPSVDLTGH